MNTFSYRIVLQQQKTILFNRAIILRDHSNVRLSVRAARDKIKKAFSPKRITHK